jgi:hypothetical protein
MNWNQIASERCRVEMTYKTRFQRVHFIVNGHSISCPESGWILLMAEFKAKIDDGDTTVFTAYHKERLPSPRCLANFTSAIYTAYDEWVAKAKESVKNAFEQGIKDFIPGPELEGLIFIEEER